MPSASAAIRPEDALQAPVGPYEATDAARRAAGSAGRPAGHAETSSKSPITLVSIHAAGRRLPNIGCRR